MRLALHNRRVFGWVIALATSAMVLAANGRWVCLDGKPCLAACAHASHGAAPQAHAVEQPAEPKCGGCPSTKERLTQESSAFALSSGGGCKLTASAQPDASLRQAEHLLLDAAALLPSDVATVAVTSAQFFFLPAAPATGPPIAEFASGRAPPARLLG